MNETLTLDQISKLLNPDANLLLRQYKVDLKTQFMAIKSVNPKMTQKKLANEIGCSDSTLKGYGKDVKMKSPYRNTDPKRIQKTYSSAIESVKPPTYKKLKRMI